MKPNVNGQDKVETWINGNSRLMLEVFHSSLADGAAVDQYPWNNTDTQRWLRVRTPDGYYEVVNVNSGKCVGVNGASPLWGASVIQWTCNGNTDQQWGYRFTGRYINARPVYNLVNRYSGLCLDVPYSSLVAGTALQQWACNRTGAQDWF